MSNDSLWYKTINFELDIEPEISTQDVFPELESIIIENEQVNLDKSIQGSWKNILIVEDDEYLAKDYGNQLEAFGFRVSYAFNADEAVKLVYYYGSYISVIVLDIRMDKGKYLSDFSTSNGLKTGISLSKEIREYVPQALIAALSMSKDYLDQAWFIANDRHFFCRKDSFPPDVFAKFIYELVSVVKTDGVLSGKDSSVSDLIGQNDEVSDNRNIEINLQKEVVMGNKYVSHGPVGAMGENATAHDFTINQIWEDNKSNINLTKLSEELVILREALAADATDNDFIDIGNIVSAEQEAKKENGSKAIEFLKKTSKKTLEIAEKIGVGVAVAAIKATTGL